MIAAEPGLLGTPMMDDGPSIMLFAVLVFVVSVGSAIVLPPVLKRLSLQRGIPALALVGPVLAIVGSLIGLLAMTLSGHAIWYSLAVSICTGAASIFVGLRLARPMARDLARVADTIEAVADGEQGARTGITGKAEIGKLAGTVDELSRTLARAETERAAAEDERRAVVSALSHDLRTPLASLLVSVEALEDQIGDPSAHLRSMKGNVFALEALIGDLFLLARADSGSLALSMESLDFAELIDEAVEAVTPMAAARNVNVQAELGGKLLVNGDHRALGRVLRNLLDNAIRFSPEGGLVSILDHSEDGVIRIQVVDEGCGFPDSFIPQAFDRFSQADDARSRPGGAGLGLAIARTLLQAHDGAIGIKAGPGGRVRVKLPRASAPAASSEGHAHRGSNQTTVTPTLAAPPRT